MRGIEGFIAQSPSHADIFIAPRPTTVKVSAEATLLMDGVSTAEACLDEGRQAGATWISPRPINPAKESIEEGERRCASVVASWSGQFQFKQENRETGEKGLRRPQIGALYAALAHWSTTEAPATIVMPTGTGKTETMLALLVNAQLGRLMVVVPNSTLRDQIAEKFATLGHLPKVGCVPANVRPPVVAKLRHRPRTVQEVDDIFRRANVVVAGMSVAGQCAPEIQERMAELCTHLFIDEAHHIAARTWSDFKRRFEGKRPILQFTATPFRTDGKRVDGRFIYSYPLSRAQQEGYFRPVKLLPVEEYDLQVADLAIARRAGAQLRADLDSGLDHLLMARADDTARAEAIEAIYQREFGNFQPVVIHSKLPPAERRARLEKLRDRESRILVCVDMFGEGFDLPQLKVAALHDRHKSLAITLQFVGRFTRDLPESVGDAHVVANIADESTTNALRNLYAEDADWNFLLRMLSETSTAKSQKRNEMLEGFTAAFDDIPLQTLFPRMSGLVYRATKENWEPLRVLDVVPAAKLHAGPVINPSENVAIYITRDEEPVRWGEVKQIQNVQWNLHVLHWNEEQGLLYINTSSKDFQERVAEAVGGSKERISGKEIFRALGGISRLMLTNLGVSHAFGKNIRYTMFMGPNIGEGLSAAALSNRKMSNVFALGYEDDEQTTVGCSFKGRLWSHKVAWDLAEWVQWCEHIGRKLLDDGIEIDAVFDKLIKARSLGERPDQVPIMVAWPEDFQSESEDRVEIEIGSASAPLYECELFLTNHAETGPLTFAVAIEGATAQFEFAFTDSGAAILKTTGAEAFAIVRGRRKTLEDWFSQDPPIVYFASGDFLVFNELFELPRGADRASFNLSKIDVWDWTGVDLTAESQGPQKKADSIQRRVIDKVKADAREYEVVFDGDGKGEVADVVAIKLTDETVTVSLFHCKYSGGEGAGARIGDFYEVCGQAQKSVHWREDPARMLKHLILQEDKRSAAGQATRFERGARRDIQNLINKSRHLVFKYEAVIVQPGLRRASVSPQFLDVLGATELFLQETFSIPLSVVVSA